MTGHQLFWGQKNPMLTQLPPGVMSILLYWPYYNKLAKPNYATLHLQLKIMIDEYKKYLKKNSEDFFFCFYLLCWCCHLPLCNSWSHWYTDKY
jgi:hypothetical protein